MGKIAVTPPTLHLQANQAKVKGKGKGKGKEKPLSCKSMVFQEITEEDAFEGYIKAEGLTICAFSASWCGPCKKLTPQFKNLSQKYPEVPFLKAMEDENEELFEKLEVTVFPTIRLYRNGTQIVELKGPDIDDIEAALLKQLGRTSHATGGDDAESVGSHVARAPSDTESGGGGGALEGCAARGAADRISSATLKKYVLNISGFESCGYFQKAVTVARALPVMHDNLFSSVEIKGFSSRDEYKASLPNLVAPLGAGAATHSSSPLVWISPEESANAPMTYVGGCDALLLLARGLPRSLEGLLGQRKPLVLFMAGDRSKVGKSSCCLGVLGALLRSGRMGAGDLAYIKPATQCEQPQLITRWCGARGVANRGVGPVVFYKGFTREFLKGNAGTSAELLDQIKVAVDEIGVGKKFVLVDGVGYPAVGSICGISNADITARLGCPALVVGPRGVGNAVDSFNLNAQFFQAKGTRVLGALFNRIETEGFYSIEKTAEAVDSYFAQYQPDKRVYGYIPELKDLVDARQKSENEEEENSNLLQLAETLIASFAEHVKVEQLIEDLRQSEVLQSTLTTVAAAPALANRSSGVTKKKRSRDEIEAAAAKQGATGG